MTIELDLYKENLEPLYLQTTQDYFKIQADSIVGSVMLSEYLLYCENKLKEERERINYYLHPSTLKPGISVM